MTRTAKKTAKAAPGAKFVTNDRFARMTGWTEPWKGEVLAAHASIEGCWKVRVDGIPVVQFVNEKFMEIER